MQQRDTKWSFFPHQVVLGALTQNNYEQRSQQENISQIRCGLKQKNKEEGKERTCTQLDMAVCFCLQFPKLAGQKHQARIHWQKMVQILPWGKH